MRNIVYHPGVPLAPDSPDAFAPEATRGDVVAVIIPCFRVSEQILRVLAEIGEEADLIYVVDDQCPERTGELVERENHDPRVSVIRNEANLGVGGATMAGMRQAIARGADIIIKLDGDGQMDPRLLPVFIEAIRSGQADYAKGNRFYDPDGLVAMPGWRLAGNAVLSFLAKLSTGYWQSFDPTNGYLAIHSEVARRLPFHKISQRYFFETDLLFRLNTLQARVVDIPMPAAYGDEKSNLDISRVILPFAFGHLRNFVKRIGYNYFLRDFSIASMELLIGLALLVFGLSFGLTHWGSTTPASAGTVMLAGLPVILGVQLLLAFISYDVQSAPNSALHPRLLKAPRVEPGPR